MRLTARREHLHLPDKKDGEWDYLSIYDRENKRLAHSDAYHPQEWIRLNHDGLEYASSPEGEVFITFKSIEEKFK